MKTIQLSVRMQRLAKVFAVGVFVFSIASCSTSNKFLTSTVTPAAKGEVTVKTDNNKNYRIKVHVVNLAQPARLTPSKSAYVVWMISADNAPKNLGKIVTSTSFFSKQLKADFETVSVEKPRKIFITAENDPSEQYLYSEVILTTNNF